MHLSRRESFDKKGLQSEPLETGGFFPITKSQDAAVGALVRMLRKAPPLRQDISSSTSLPEPSRTERQSNSRDSEEPSDQHAASPSVSSSTSIASKTTADALEELRTYREMKDLLVRQGARSNT